MIKGFDISAHNKSDKDFAKARAAGFVFAYRKLTEGQTHLNPRAHEDIAAMQAAGIAVGAYHFARIDTNGDDPLDAAKEALWFVSNLPATPLALPPALDLECKVGNGTSDEVLAWALQWSAVVCCLTGRWPLWYSFPAWIKRHMKQAKTEQILDHALWWISHVGVKTPDVSAIGGHADLWQHSWLGSVPGIPGAVDVNETELTLEELVRLGERPRQP